MASLIADTSSVEPSPVAPNASARHPSRFAIRAFTVAAGDTVFEDHPLAFIEERADLGGGAAREEAIDPDYIRPDLKDVLDRRARAMDEARPKAVARRRATGQRTARENISDVCDPGTFVEYGSLVLSARRRTVPMEQLIDESPADGLIMGLAQINNQWFPEEKSRAVVVSYDYTVMAGTQGHMGHHKQDRMFEMAEKWRLPVVIFCEGGGGRGSDTDNLVSFSETFHRLPRLSGLVPLVGIASGRCFAGNAVLLGCCDVIIATEGSTIGMAGPAMIEGGGLGVYRPEEVGPMSVQVPNGVVDILVKDEVEAVKVARQYMSYFQGRNGPVRINGSSGISCRKIVCAVTTCARLWKRSPTTDPCWRYAKALGMG